METILARQGMILQNWGACFFNKINIVEVTLNFHLPEILQSIFDFQSTFYNPLFTINCIT